jgi:hypothetical protein
MSMFSVSVSLNFPCTVHASFPKRLYNHFRCTLTEICTKYDAIPLLDPSRDGIRSDTRLQIKWYKTWNFEHWLARYGSTTINRCFALLQLLYRWQHQSKKLWIPARGWKIKFSELKGRKHFENLTSSDFLLNIGSKPVSDLSVSFPYTLTLSHFLNSIVFLLCSVFWSDLNPRFTEFPLGLFLDLPS